MIPSLFAPVPARMSDPIAPAAATAEPRRLAALVRDLAATPDAWAHLVHFDPRRRWWTRLDSPSGTDVWLLTWLRSQSTDLHDHGDALAAFAVVRGELDEVRPAGSRLSRVAVRRGEVRTVDRGQVHDVLNTRSSPAVSIHAYAPALTSMTFYDWSGGRLSPQRTVRTSEPELAEAPGERRVSAG